jgi:phosphatidylserine/phosphatidylglycerophosphate/cardiolipin synthase-like enzyme
VILNKAKAANKTKAAALEAIGAHVFTTSKTLHEKFALLDAGTWYRRKLINGSANWSTGAQFKYSENTVVYNRHYGIFYAFQQEFNDLLDLSRPVSADAADHDDPVTSLNRPSTRVHRRERAVFSSWNSGGTEVIADEIIAMMWAAEESIKIDVAHFNSRRIADELIQIHADYPDIEIEVLVDMGEYGDSKSRAKKLEAGGINVRYKTYSLGFHHPRSQLMHHKTMIVDDKDMITGSYNWSTTAEQKNYENVIVVEGTGPNQAFVKAFVEEHERLWDGGRDVYPDFLATITASPGDPEYRRVIPVHFDTDYFRGFMTLTRDEVKPLRRVAYRSGLFGHPSASYLDKRERKVFTGTLPDDFFLDAPTVTAANTSGLAGLGN